MTEIILKKPKATGSVYFMEELTAKSTTDEQAAIAEVQKLRARRQIAVEQHAAKLRKKAEAKERSGSRRRKKAEPIKEVEIPVYDENSPAQFTGLGQQADTAGRGSND